MFTSRFRVLLVVLFLTSVTARADWQAVSAGVDYQKWDRPLVAYVVRIDLTNPELRIISTPPDERGTAVSEFSKRHHAIVAINGDYFDDKFRPVGLAIGECSTVWSDSKDVHKEGVVAIGEERVNIFKPHAVDEPEDWMRSAVSGWPLLVDDCRAYNSNQLPGSDYFTRTPLPRTAVGLSGDGRYLFFVVVDGRRKDAHGATLAQLGGFMKKRLGACRVINLDGGGSSAMWVDGKIVNRPSDGSERKVANHLAVVNAEDAAKCFVEPSSPSQ